MFLNFLIWLILIYLLFRVSVRYLFPFIVKWYIKRFQRRFYEENPHLKKEKKNKETEIRIKRKQSRKINTDKLGEYVDFEEVDDN